MNAEDRKLLELAAKAAGIKPPESVYEGRIGNDRSFVFYPDCEGRTFKTWNPIKDDGDALRLAVKLRIGFRYEENSPSELGLPTECATAVIGGRWYAEAPKHGDENAATRRAIVRAAAEIGGRMA